jgi:acetyl-CoA carboxylase carboxyl transferase subunit alpha
MRTRLPVSAKTGKLLSALQCCEIFAPKYLLIDSYQQIVAPERVAMRHFLDFEKPIASLEGKVEELRHMSTDGSINIADEIGKLQTRIERELKQTYEKLGAWEKVQVARHPDRPKVSAIFDRLLTDFTPLSGDRNYAEDHAVIAGMARFRGQPVMVMGTEKGSSTEERVKRNFGMARPEGYRKGQQIDGSGRTIWPAGA